MNKQRLRVLAEHLRTVPKEHFDLQRWVIVDGGNIRNGTFTEVGCGTTACAIGWCANIPEFYAAGFRLKDGGDGSIPEYLQWSNWDAVTHFFNIDYKAAMGLFTAAYYPAKDLDNPQTVVRRILEFIK